MYCYGSVIRHSLNGNLGEKTNLLTDYLFANGLAANSAVLGALGDAFRIHTEYAL
jgi:hypothetical protein